METVCKICKKSFSNILEHISIKHHISSIEEYNMKVKEIEEKDIKIQEFLKYSREQMERFRKGEISPEQLRSNRAKWEQENNLW